MAVFTTPRPYPFHEPTQAFPDRLPLDDPVSTACLGPIVGKSEKVEGRRAPRRLVATWWPLERSQHRLFGMHGQAETGKPPREDFHHPAGVGFQLEADDKIIGKTRYKAPALHPGVHVFDKPCVQDPLQEYIRHHGREYTSYKVANLPIEFSTSIPRTQLRPGYGEGFLGAPLQRVPSRERPAPRGQGDPRGTSRTHRQHNPGGAHHV